MSSSDALTADLEKKSQALLSLVEDQSSPIKSGLSDVPLLRDAYIELRNIARALDQYARTNRGLRYIGLMGTFSSGKSSIINSLIAQDARTADLPPIDNEITILTHPSNRDALIAAHSRGLLKVTTQPVEADLLQSCFLVDTPGSGDPEVREGMVKDFLPICDLILYVFSSTSALSIPDLSILKMLQDRLDFVPLRFVVTRSDEFRKDHLAVLSDDNIDQTRLEQFLSSLIARIRSQAPNLDLSPENFLFVDNRAKFGIPALKDRILAELQSDVHLHSKKIAYFRRGIAGQKAIFEDYLLELVDGLEKLEQKAKENKESYEKHVVLSMASINDFWRPREGVQTARLSSFNKVVDDLEGIQSKAIPDFSSKWLSLPRVQKYFEQKSSELSSDLCRHLIDLGNGELHRLRNELDVHLTELIRRKGAAVNASAIPLPGYRSQILRLFVPNLARDLETATELARGELTNELRDGFRVEQSAFTALFDHVSRGDLFNKDGEYYRDFEKIIRANFSEFLPIVGLFKSAVTSAQARTLIARTGLGEKLDVLDNADLDAAAANLHAEEFLRSVFAARNATRDALASSAAALLEQKDGVESGLSELFRRLALESRMGSDPHGSASADIDAEQLLRPIVEFAALALEKEIKPKQDAWDRTIQQAHTLYCANLQQSRMRFFRAWLRRFSGIAGVAAFFGVVAVAGLFLIGLPERIGWAFTVLSGALTTITTWVIGWGRKRLSSTGQSFPKTSWRVASEAAEKTVVLLDSASIGQSQDFDRAMSQAKDEFSAGFLSFLSKDKDKRLPDFVAWAESERELIQGKVKYVDAYLQAWRNLANAMNNWYRPDEFKKEVISKTAESVKERAVEPALKLFAGRLGEVLNFADRIRAIVV